MIYLDSNGIQSRYGISIDASVQIESGVQVQEENVKKLVEAGRNYYDSARETVQFEEAFRQKHQTLPSRASENQKNSIEYKHLVNAQQKKDEAFETLSKMQNLGYSLLKA